MLAHNSIIGGEMELIRKDRYTDKDASSVMELADKIDDVCCSGEYTNGQVLSAMVTALGWHLANAARDTELASIQILINNLPENLTEIVKSEINELKKNMQ